MTDKRPVYLNLFKIRLPMTGVVSFAHRVSGVLLFLVIPFAIFLLDLSVASEQGFSRGLELLQHPVLQAVQLILVWALAHHFLAGIRYLFLDLDIGIEKASSTQSAWFVLVAEAVIVAAWIWSVWS